MEWLSQKFQEYWYLCVNYYHVDPVIFLTMYVTKSIIFFWLLAVIVKRVMRRQWNSLVWLVLLNICIDVAPWVYVWICGDNQPWWYPYMVYCVAGWGLVALFFDVKRRLRESAARESAKADGNAASEVTPPEPTSSPPEEK